MAAYIIGSDKAFLRIRGECPICEMVKKLSCLMIATLENLMVIAEASYEIFCVLSIDTWVGVGAILNFVSFSFSCGETPAAAALAGTESFVVATHWASVGSGIFPALLD
jgi:hypothetical protein